MEDINTLTQKANSGDAVAMRKLGYEYLIGKNIQKTFLFIGISCRTHLCFRSYLMTCLKKLI